MTTDGREQNAVTMRRTGRSADGSDVSAAISSEAARWTLLSHAFGSEELRRLFDDRQLIRRWLEVEVVLAEAEAAANLIPDGAARAIREAAQALQLNVVQLRREIDRTSHPLVPFLRALQAACPRDAAEYVHWGATTQDVTDTASVLLIRDALAVIDQRSRALHEILLFLAAEHRDRLMVGRTHGQHAGPITLGFKFAVIADEMGRHLERIAQLRPRVLVGQLGGATGSLASLGDAGVEVQRHFMQRLGLGVPAIPWHTARDGLAELIAVLSMLAATAGKIANEIRVLQATEIDELREPHPEGTVGSSTMPHKRNPMVSENVVAIAKLARQAVPLVLDAMVQEHERDMSLWGVEWEVTRDAFVLAGGALEHSARVLRDLTVNDAAMARNVALIGDTLMSESVMMGLAPLLGRQRAYDLVRDLCADEAAGGPPFAEGLLGSSEVRGVVSDQQLRRLLDPGHYTGLCGMFVDRVLAAAGRSDAVRAGDA